MSDEEDDYMSDKFLSERLDLDFSSNYHSLKYHNFVFTFTFFIFSVVADIRPGLLKSHSDVRSFQALKRKRELDELNKKKNPNIKVLECEKRKEGLEKPLEQNNKGFALLQKMGYKPGDGIGKSGKHWLTFIYLI